MQILASSDAGLYNIITYGGFSHNPLFALKLSSPIAFVTPYRLSHPIAFVLYQRGIKDRMCGPVLGTEEMQI